MLRIEGLLTSLVTVIVSYHGSKVVKEASAMPEAAPDSLLKKEEVATEPQATPDLLLKKKVEDLLLKPDPELVAALTLLIEEATKEPEAPGLFSMSIYVPRRPLLMYILHGVTILRPIVTSPEPLEDRFTSAKGQLTLLLTDLHTLLSTSQSTAKECKYGDQIVQVNGLVRRFWPTLSLCGSGSTLQTFLFPALGLPVDADLSRITKTADSILNEHHLDLLKKVKDELKRTKESLVQKDAKITTLEKDLAASRLALESKHPKDDAYRAAQQGSVKRLPKATTAHGGYAPEKSGPTVHAVDKATIRQQPTAFPPRKPTGQSMRGHIPFQTSSTHSFWPKFLGVGLHAIAQKLGDVFEDPSPRGSAPVHSDDDSLDDGDSLNHHKQN